ncbi:extracellular sulfatase Sulf-1-like isoform X2 [Acanthaster planci]|uniref:Extracellular sulfatase Sulf-1-like isoform X2 n=1 Tax=Acanthaster planci TaxID=133434 RepID=A0A8B7Z906_ACAPL|nr:extracellular sulfatase Sulf-1-like isoform X2 [Acanthaster planci]
MLHQHRHALCVLLYLMLLWLTNCTWVSAGRTGRRGQGSLRSQPQSRPRYLRNRKPNIVLVITDDQDLLLGSMSAMNKTQMVLGDSGANFINAFVTTPICCPSRSSILTGQYVHNHHVYSNTEHCGSLAWQGGPERRTFAAYLRSVDYRTGYFGKYLNNYNGTYVPPGWTEWVGLLQNSKYYNYTLSRNGQLYDHGFNYYRDYLPDLIANDSLAFFKMSKRTYPDNPIAMVLSFPSPHGPEDGAPQYQGLFEGNRLHRTETWNYSNNNDKHWLLRYPDPLTEQEMAFTDLLQRKRLITLVSVDDAIAKLCTELSEMGELDNTYIIFTSDHGYHLGQYALPKGKSLPYDFDLRVPFYIRGPRIPRGVEVPNIVLNIDLAPTMLDMAGLNIPPNMDGVSLLKLFNPADYRIKGRSRNRRLRYVGVDPWRTSFLVEKTRSPEDLARLQKRQFQARGRKGDRLRQQCKEPEFQSPCKPFQDKECVLDEVTGEVKIRKCRRPPKIRCRCMRVIPSSPNEEGLANGRRFRLRDRPPVSDAALTREEKRQQRDFIQEHVKEANPPFRFIRNRRDHTPKEDPAVFTLDNLDEPDEENILIDPKCEVYKNDTVMCDNEIFESRKAWVNHRKLIAARVRLLRKHLNDLIEIKEFLKDTNPYYPEKPRVELPLPARLDSRREKPAKVCRCDNIEGELSEKAARELERLGDVYVENRGDYEISEGPTASRYTRSTSATERTTEQNSVLDMNTDGLSRRQRKIQSKQMCSVQGMKCTSHDNDHWRVPPYWTLGHMCLCLNAVNNTYQCLRYLNETHNFLYCEYVTNFLEYFDMRPGHDPYQKVNAINDITDNYRRFMRDELENYRHCSGASNCTALYPTPNHHGKTGSAGRQDKIPKSESHLWKKFNKRRKSPRRHSNYVGRHFNRGNF